MTDQISHTVYTPEVSEYRALEACMKDRNSYVLNYVIYGIMSNYFDNIYKYNLSVLYDIAANKFIITGVEKGITTQT
jgi:hypothetical protein